MKDDNNIQNNIWRKYKYNKYINSCKTLQKIQKEILKLADELVLLNNAIIMQMQLDPSNEEQIQSLYQNRINDLQVTLHGKLSANLKTFLTN